MQFGTGQMVHNSKNRNRGNGLETEVDYKEKADTRLEQLKGKVERLSNKKMAERCVDNFIKFVKEDCAFRQHDETYYLNEADNLRKSI